MDRIILDRKFEIGKEVSIQNEVRKIWSNDSPSRTYVAKRQADLTEQVEDELRKYQAYLSTVIDTTTDESMAMGSRQAVEMMKALTLGQRAILGIDFNKLPVETINTMLGFLAPDSPLYKRIEYLAGYYAPQVKDAWWKPSRSDTTRTRQQRYLSRFMRRSPPSSSG